MRLFYDFASEEVRELAKKVKRQFDMVIYKQEKDLES